MTGEEIIELVHGTGDDLVHGEGDRQVSRHTFVTGKTTWSATNRVNPNGESSSSVHNGG